MSTALANAVNGNGAKTPPELAAKIQMIKAMYGELGNAIPPAIQKTLTPDRMARLAVTAMRQVRNLDQCTFASLAGALMVAAQLGLEPCTPLGHCYLIPRKNGRTGQFEATFQLGYQGMLELAYRTETIKSVTAKAVHANDEFLYEEGLDDKLVHRPYLGGDRGRVVAYYAVIKFTNGGHAFDVMSFGDMVQHMERFAPTDYKSGKVTGPWATDFDEMAKKTMIRRLFKMMRKSTDIIAKATLYDERVIDRDTATSELRPQFEEPRAAPQIESGLPEVPEFVDIEPETEPKVAEEPETPAETARPAVKAVKRAPKKKAPTQPAGDSAPKPSPLAESVKQIEEWCSETVAKHEAEGLPDLADKTYLLQRVYEVMVRMGILQTGLTGFYTQANAIAKVGIEAGYDVRSYLEEANGVVREEYLGVPEESEPEAQEQPEPAAKPAKKSETAAEKMAAIEKWFEAAAEEFGNQGHRSLVMPSAAVAAVYSLAHKAGLILGAGQANGYRTRLLEITEIPGSSHDVIQKLKPFCKELLAELESPEPGSDG